MTAPSQRLILFIIFTRFLIFQLPAQTIDATYLGHWFHYPSGSPSKPDSNYTRVDTFIEMTYRSSGTFNIKGYTKSDIFTPGKGHLKFRKNFRYMDGNYKIMDNQLEILTGFKASETDICKIFEFESSTNKTGKVNPYFKLWDTRSFFEYALVANFKDNDSFFSKRRQQQTLYIETPGQAVDSIVFWTTSPNCAHDNDWPKPALLNTDVPLKKSMLDSVGNLVEDLEKIYIYNSGQQLIRYFYTSKKDKSFYYDMQYINDSSAIVKSITDSKDGSSYVFIRDEKGCLLKIEHHDIENKLTELYYVR